MTRRVALVPLALLGVMIAELVTFVMVGYLIGFGWTVLLVLLASLAGLVLLRREGLRAWRRFREAARTGTPPGPHVTDGLAGLGGALLLATPGLLTGVAGAVLLVPPVRGLARGRIQARAERWMSSAEAGQVFGPRRVRVRPTRPEPADPDAATDGPGVGGRPEAPVADEVIDGEILEGEIVDPK